MPKFPGYIEWDDDELRPGKREGGGEYSNLFDSEGKPKGSATFYRCDEAELQPKNAREVVYARKGSRGDGSFKEDMKDIAAQAIVSLVVQGLEKAAPHVQAGWVSK